MLRWRKPHFRRCISVRYTWERRTPGGGSRAGHCCRGTQRHPEGQGGGSVGVVWERQLNCKHKTCTLTHTHAFVQTYAHTCTQNVHTLRHLHTPAHLTYTPALSRMLDWAEFKGREFPNMTAFCAVAPVTAVNTIKSDCKRDHMTASEIKYS